MEFENMSRYERIDMMRRRFEWLSKFVKNYLLLKISVTSMMIT